MHSRVSSLEINSHKINSHQINSTKSTPTKSTWHKINSHEINSIFFYIKYSAAHTTVRYIDTFLVVK